MFLSKLSATVLTVALLEPGAWAQQSPATADGLKITIVQGENEKNNIRLKLAVVPIVEVRDEHDRLLPGVRVAFVLPKFGPSGTFSDGSNSNLVWTDTQGRAAAQGLVPNATEGKFGIRVTATYSGKTGSTTIFEENTTSEGPQKAPPIVSEEKKKSNKLFYILALVGGAAAIGMVTALGGSKSSAGAATAAPTVISLGTIAVGGPH